MGIHNITGSDPAALASPADTQVPARGAATNRDTLYLVIVTACVSVAAFIVYFRHDAILLYGDAVAHMHIARRVFDSRTPGPLQLGTVWLPLPHILMLPFVISRWMWSSGLGGSIPSMLAYVAGTLGIFRLMRHGIAGIGGQHDTAARVAAWCAAVIYAGNPNLIYLQATAMTEPLYLALFIWATVFFAEFVRVCDAGARPSDSFTPVVQPARRALRRCGILLLLAMLTRYDGWFAAVIFVTAAFLVMWRWTGRRIVLWRSPMRPAFTGFVLVVAAAPLIWFVYNTAVWGNPLEFATGPYSARAIEQRSSSLSRFHHPGWHSPRTALVYFAKSARLNVADGLQREYGNEPRLRAQNIWILLALAGTALLLLFARGLWPLLLLWMPVPFYMLSITWGGVPIFMPAWWPFSYYNVRYGLQLLPAFAVLSAAALYVVAIRLRPKPVLALATALLLGFTGVSYAGIWRSTPICLMEARANSETRLPFELKLGAELQQLPPEASFLMYTASNAGALQRAGIRLRRTINETNRRLWETALLRPAATVDFVVASDGDPVAFVMRYHAQQFEPLAVVDVQGQARTVIYRRKR
ncbi:MAG: hypothetical protein ACE14M_01885 [Terriglobales bacterium]